MNIGISNNRGAELSALVDHAIEVPTGPEVIAGSTRLKAGTAQKVVLNAYSTAVMVKFGKTLGPLMVDMKASNEKLRERAVRMVRIASEVEPEAARAALIEANWSTTTAIVMLRRGIGADVAHELLTQHGSVRSALEAS